MCNGAMPNSEHAWLVRYLGVPLITTRLRYKDCLPIFNKKQGKIQGWAVKKLSYGGTLQLIKSVLNSLRMY